MKSKKSSVATDSRSRFTLSIKRFVVSLTALLSGHNSLVVIVSEHKTKLLTVVF
jgi:hypothetical protein